MASAQPSAGFTNIAVLRLSSLGDVILTLPVVAALERAYPQARISFWTKQAYQDVVRFDPAIDHVRVLERDSSRMEDMLSMSSELEDCDLIVDLHGNLRTRVLAFRQRAKVVRVNRHRLLRSRWVHARWSGPGRTPHALERYAAAVRPLGLEVPGTPRVHAGEEAARWAQTWVSQRGQGAPVALCPGARHATKRWPQRHWIALHERLIAAGRTLVYFSLTREREALPALAELVEEEPRAHWCCEPLPRIAAMLGECEAAVACDSGLMHLAAACGTRVVALFGSTAPELGFAPAGDGHEVLCRREACQPCTLHGREACPRGHFNCMEKLAPSEVGERLEAFAAR